MKKLVLYLLLLLSIPATAQLGPHGKKPHPAPPTPEMHQPRPKPGPPGHPASPHGRQGMNQRDYEDAVRIISEENFDDKRLSTAKRIITVNSMSTRQIAGICRLFTFEAKRLDFAKFAYRYCVDPNKYFLLDEVFTFEASKEELYKYIQKK